MVDNYVMKPADQYTCDKLILVDNTSFYQVGSDVDMY